jgi:hypothetical protein
MVNFNFLFNNISFVILSFFFLKKDSIGYDQMVINFQKALVNYNIDCAIWIREKLEKRENIEYSINFRLSEEKTSRENWCRELVIPNGDCFYFIVYMSQLRNIWDKELKNGFLITFWVDSNGKALKKQTMSNWVKELFQIYSPK